MLLLYDVVLGLVVAFHVVGGATLFRRAFPVESPWLGFILPSLAVVLALNFIEHFVALPVLWPLLTLTVPLCAWSVFGPGCRWEDLRLPSNIFLAVFAFNFGYRCLHPDIPTDDAMADMNRILDFCFGDKVPPTDSWLPPFDHRWYYTLQHYGASIVKRLFGLEIGTACNTSLALLNSLICVTGCGVAFLAGGRRAWIAIITAPMLEAGFTGAMPLLVLTMPHPDFGYAVDIDAGWREHDAHPLFGLLAHDPHEALVLEPPGDWIWHPQYHANLSGFLLLFLAAFAALEVLGPRRVNWAWICLLVIPPLSMLASAWYVPLCGLLCAGSLGLALAVSNRPKDWRFVLTGVSVALVSMWPGLQIFGTWPSGQEMGWTLPHERTPFWVFVIQWWPVYVPWLVLCFLWRRLGVGVRWLHGAIAFLLVFIELVTFGDWRWDTIEKMWGGLFGLGLVALLPPLMATRHSAARAIVLVLLFATIVTIEARLYTAGRWIDWDKGFLHLEGSSYFSEDPQKSRMLDVLGKLHARTILAGICRWNYTPPPGLAVFTENRCYVAWFGTEEICGRGAEARRRTALNNAFYAGDMAEPLPFLHANEIAAVLIAPEDKISDARLAQMKRSLAPDYDYVDCHAGQTGNAGVFLIRAKSSR